MAIHFAPQNFFHLVSDTFSPINNDVLSFVIFVLGSKSLAGDINDKSFIKKALRGVRSIICPNVYISALWIFCFHCSSFINSMLRSFHCITKLESFVHHLLAYLCATLHTCLGN